NVLWPRDGYDLARPADHVSYCCSKRSNRELGCSLLLAVRSELLEEAPQIFGFLLVLDPRKRHFGARNLRHGIVDVFLEGFFVPDDPGILVRIRVIVAWHRACLASFQAVLDWADRVFSV